MSRRMRKDTDEIRDGLKDAIYRALKQDRTDGEKKLIIRFGSTHHVIFHMNDGKINSVVRCYNAFGDVISYIQYVNDERMGMYIKYHENGQVSVVGAYRASKRYGQWKDYDRNGNVVRSYFYND